MSLTYVKSNHVYSTYVDEHGAEVFLAHGSGFRRLVPFDEIDLVESWQEFVAENGYNRYEWLSELKRITTEPHIVSSIEFCDDCSEPLPFAEDGYSTRGGYICEGCIDSYTECDSCDNYSLSTTTTLDGTEICDQCRDYEFSFCEDCDGYYRPGSEDHDHDDECDCESPALSFTVRNDGDPALRSDTRVTVALPAGEISAEGMLEISYYLRSAAFSLSSEDERNLHDCSYYLDEVGAVWQRKDGNFTKRLSRFAYKKYGLKLSPEIMSKVGCIARDHSTAVDFCVDVTRDLNQPAAAFFHEGSCWWQSHAESRCALKFNGGYGLRSFDQHGDVSGRAWVMPLKADDDGRLSPTFETMTPDAFVVFNGYGDLSGYAPARIISHMAGMTYRKITFRCSPMFVNGDGGYLVAPEEIAKGYTDGTLSFSLNEHADLYDFERMELTHVA